MPDFKTYITINQTTYNSDVSFFEMKIPIELKGAGMDTTIILNHTFSGQLFEVNPGSKVDSVFFDPKSKTLYYQSNVALNQVTSSINQIESGEKVVILTNPATNELKIRCRSGEYNYLQLYNLDGKVEITNPVRMGANLIEIDIRNLSPGIYILKAGNSDWFECKKFIVVK